MSELAADRDELHVVVDSREGARTIGLRLLVRSVMFTAVSVAVACLPLWAWPDWLRFGIAGLVACYVVETLAARRWPSWGCLVLDDGIRLGRGRTVHHLPWSRIRSVEERTDRVVIHLVDGEVELDTGNADVFSIARRVAMAIGQSDAVAEGRGSLDEAEVARLIARGGRPSVEAPLPEVLSPAVGWIAVGAMVFAAAMAVSAEEPAMVPVAIAAGVVLYVASRWIGKGGVGHPYAVRVEPAGVVVRRRRAVDALYAWHDIHSVGDLGQEWRLRTYHGDLKFDRVRTGEVLAAIRRVLDVRDAGHALPRLGLVGDAAISPVRAGDERAERGISRSDGPERRSAP